LLLLLQTDAFPDERRSAVRVCPQGAVVERHRLGRLPPGPQEISVADDLADVGGALGPLRWRQRNA
ncbi:hypothetical protein SB775_29020, partial [Peribacillus sp. SIMBA_075]|uniref:hypothetical protein n=1 Tax=Peribacillus sp. SIMBA_075 TaxID=3085813 RepID=UPI00397ADB7D